MESLASVAAAAAEPAAEEQAAAAPLPQSTQRRVGEIVLARSPGYTLWPAQVVCPTVVRARRAAMCGGNAGDLAAARPVRREPS